MKSNQVGSAVSDSIQKDDLCARTTCLAPGDTFPSNANASRIVGEPRRIIENSDELEIARSDSEDHPIRFADTGDIGADRDTRIMTRLLRHRIEQLAMAVKERWGRKQLSIIRPTAGGGSWDSTYASANYHTEGRIADITLDPPPIISGSEDQLSELSGLCQLRKVGFEFVQYMNATVSDPAYLHVAVPREDYLFRLRDTERFQLYRPNGSDTSIDFDHIKHHLVRYGWDAFSILYQSGLHRDYQFFQQSMGHPNLVVQQPEASRSDIPILPPTGFADLTLGRIIFETANGRGHQPKAFFRDPADRINGNAELQIVPVPLSDLPTVAAAPSIEAVELSLLRFSDHRQFDEPSSELERLQVDRIELQRLTNHLTNPNGDRTNRRGSVADQLPGVPSFGRYSVAHPTSLGQNLEIRVPDRIKPRLISLDLPGHSSLTRILDAIALQVGTLWYWSEDSQITFTNRR